MIILTNQSMNRLTGLIRLFWPSAIVLAVILYATLCQSPLGANEIPPIPHIDKLIHAIMMGGFFSAIIFDLQRADRSRIVTRRTMLAVAVGVMVFGGLDEIGQMLMDNGRSGELLDLVADWTGVWVAYFTAPPAIRGVLKISKTL